MSHKIVDKRSNGKVTDNNRDKFLKRVKNRIIKALPHVIDGESIKELTNKKGVVKVPIKGIKEHQFTYDSKTGKRERILPGNKEYNKGDQIEKPPSGGGRGRKGSKDDEISEDEFTIILSKDEFFQYFFHDLELPNLVKKSLNDNAQKKYERAGLSPVGPQNKLNIGRTFKKSLSRRIGIEMYLKKRIKELEDQLLVETNAKQKEVLELKIKELKLRLNSILFFDNIDLTYNYFEEKIKPNTRAVMVCIMDVSGSMTFEHKDIAKRFFLLLYLFLEKNYEHVELVFIRHHTEATEVSEKDFFESKETGGTMVAPSIKLANKIIEQRYSANNWNVYCCQASDGDVWGEEDALECRNLLESVLLPKLQYMAYIDIQPRDATDPSDLYAVYSKIESRKFSAKIIEDVSGIWMVFKGLFKKNAKKAV